MFNQQSLLQKQSSTFLLNPTKRTKTNLSQNEPLDINALSLLFSQVDEEAAKYVKEHIDLLPTLSDAREHIKKYFPNTLVRLAGNFNESGLIIGVFIEICTTFNYKESLEKSNKLDDDWIIPNISRLDKILIDLRF